MAMVACKKEIVSAHIQLHMPESVFQLDEMIPELADLTMEPDFMGYCLTIPNPDIEFSFGIDRMWVDSAQNEYSIPLPGLSVPAFFEEPLEWPFSFNDSLILHNLHWPEGLEEIYSASVSGTMTLHFSFPDDLPFDKVFLHPFLSVFYLPDYLYINKYSISEKSMHWEWKKNRSQLYFSNPGMWIPREGLDVSMRVFGINPDALGPQEDGNRCLRGSFSGSGVFWLYPEDARSDAEGSFDGTLTVTVSFSDLSFDHLHCKLDTDLFETEKIVKVPFPKFEDERIDHYDKPCILVAHQTSVTDYDYGPYYHIVQRFFSIKGEETYSTPAIGVPRFNSTVFYMAETDIVWREGWENEPCPKLKDLFCVLPDSLGICVTCDQLAQYLYPGEISRFQYISKWRIPLFLTGTDWDNICYSQEYSIGDLVANAIPGSEITMTILYDNRQPFSVTCTPIFVDSEGIRHELTDQVFLIEGGDLNNIQSGTFEAHKPAGDKVKDESFYIKLEFCESCDLCLKPGQSLHLGLDRIKKTMYLD